MRKSSCLAALVIGAVFASTANAATRVVLHVGQSRTIQGYRIACVRAYSVNATAHGVKVGAGLTFSFKIHGTKVVVVCNR